jgi:hypothetical protein
MGSARPVDWLKCRWMRKHFNVNGIVGCNVVLPVV